MNNYFIGGVATVAAFRNNEHMFTAKSLTDSSINISVSSEEIRGGTGAQLLGKFFHTTVFNLTLTDALFNMKYLVGQTGGTEGPGEAVVWKTVKPSASTIRVDDGKIYFKVETGDTIAQIDFDAYHDGNLYVWSDQLDETFKVTANTEVTGEYYFDPGSVSTSDFTDGTYCITYPTTVSGNQIIVNTDYAPGIFSLIMRAKLFAGDACNVSDGKPVGEIVIEIPRFQLDGTIDLAMAMTSPATYTLNGSALANGCGCGEDMWYAKITQVLFSTDPYAGYNSIVVNGDTYNENGDYLAVYAIGSAKVPKLVPLDNCTITCDPVGAVVTTGTDKGKVSGIAEAKPNSSTVTVTASGIQYQAANGSTVDSVINNEFVTIIIPNTAA